MADIADDWFGIDPPPKPPEAIRPAPPAPARKRTGTNVTTGVDATRRLLAQTAQGSTGTSSRSGTPLISVDEDIGVGLNV